MSLELAVNDEQDQQNEHSDDGSCNDFVGDESIVSLIHLSNALLPSSHTFERLHALIDISIRLHKPLPCIPNLLALCR